MRKFTRRLYLLTALVVSASACVHAVANSVNILNERDSLDLYVYVYCFLIVAWLITDPKLPTNERPSFDHGLLHLMYFPLLAVYEQYGIRRWKGIAIVFGLLALLIAPFISMLIWH